MSADDIQRALGRIEGKMDSFLTVQAQHRETLEKHDERLDGLEKWQGKVIGGLALASFVIGIIVKAIL